MIVFAGGGTGGHLTPGIALAEAARARGMEVLFCTSGRAVERLFLDAALIDHIDTGAAAPGRTLRAMASFCCRTLRATVRVRSVLRRRRPCLAVGLGGYGSLPLALAAAAEGVPLALLEQNVVAGRANRLLAPLAEVAICQWPAAARRLCATRRLVLGNPVRSEIFAHASGTSNDALADPSHRARLLVMGGSNGAAGIDRWIAASLPHLAPFAPRISIAHITGERDRDLVKGAYARSPLSSFSLFDHVRHIGELLAESDLVVCRAGATTLAELSAAGRPAFLVPYPQALDGHQLANARTWCASGAGLWRHQDELTAQLLVDLVGGVLLRPDRLAHMRTAARRAGHPAPADQVLAALLEYARPRTPGPECEKRNAHSSSFSIPHSAFRIRRRLLECSK